MLKRYLLIILGCCLLNACNDDEKKPVEANIVSAQEQSLKDAVTTFPDSLLLREQLIQYYRDTGDYEKAIAATDGALTKDSTNDRLWEIKANLHFENYDTVNAIKAFRKAADIFPSPQYIIPLGSMYAQTRDSMALKVADFIIRTKMTPDSKEAFFIKGLYYNFTGDKKAAISFFDKCLNLDYNYMFAYREKAIALYDMGRYEDAITVLDKAVTLQNKFDEGYYWLGRCPEKTNKAADAIQEYRNALRLTPDYVEAKEALTRLGIK